MIAKPASRFFKVRDVIALFVQMGCIFNIAEDTVQDETGATWGFGYLVNPENQTFVPVLDLELNDSIAEGEVIAWQRVLELQIPLPEP